jgi:Antitoxin VbhA/Fic/DOC family
MAVATHPLTATERARRVRVYEEALASVRLEGFELDEQVKALYQRYVHGQMTLADVGSAIDGINDREFGSVSPSRHKRTQEPARPHDPELLSRFEARQTHRRIAELIDTPITGIFDAAHLKAIHRHIFQDVYEWAGEFQTVNISKEGQLFGLSTFLEPALQQIMAISPSRSISLDPTLTIL